MRKDIRGDLKCHHCFKNESSRLLFFQKTYRESGEKVFEHPALICDLCAEDFRARAGLFEGKPIILSYIHIGSMPFPKVMWLASDKGKAHNEMASPIWRKKLARIKKIYQYYEPKS